MSNEAGSGKLRALKDLWLTIGLVRSVNAWLMLVLMGLELVSGLLPAWLTSLAKQWIDSLVSARAHHQGLNPVIGLLFFLLVGWRFNSAMDTIADAMMERLKDKTATQATLRVLKKVPALDLAQVETPEVQDVLRQASKDVNTKPLEAVHYLASGLRCLVLIVSLGAVLWQLGAWFIPVGLALAATPFSIAETFFSWKGYWTLRRNTPQLRQMDYLFEVLTSVEYFIEVKLYGVASFLTGWYQERREDLSKEVERGARRRFVTQFFLSLLWDVAAIAAYLYAGSRFLTGHISVGELAQYLTVMTLFRSSVQPLMFAIAKVYEATLLTRALFQLENYHPQVVSPHPAQPMEPAVQGRGLQIEFQGVSFEYTPGQPVLKDLSFTMMAGQSTALVGLNGAGKTTLVKLIMRYYDPTDGVILVNGRNIKTYNLEGLRAMISAVVQDFHLFEISMAQNIGLGNLPQIENQRLIEEAARRSQIHSVVAALPDGYQTLLGNAFKTMGGFASTRLSGGERQRLALARCLVGQAGLLILDEWTSSLDPIVVAQLLKNFGVAMREAPATQLLISHTLSVAKNSDQIIALEGGRIIEQGTHASLMESGGRYAEMFNLQAKQYR